VPVTYLSGKSKLPCSNKLLPLSISDSLSLHLALFNTPQYQAIQPACPGVGGHGAEVSFWGRAPHSSGQLQIACHRRPCVVWCYTRHTNSHFFSVVTQPVDRNLTHLLLPTVQTTSDRYTTSTSHVSLRLAPRLASTTTTHHPPLPPIHSPALNIHHHQLTTSHTPQCHNIQTPPSANRPLLPRPRRAARRHDPRLALRLPKNLQTHP
jgi:hypothetical protein